MSTISQLMAAGRKLDGARARLNFLTLHDDRRDELATARASYEACLDDYRRLLEDITGQHADVIQRRLS